MSDPLSVAAGIAGLISLGIQVTQSLFTFYELYKGRDIKLARTRDKLQNLLTVFRALEHALQNRQDEQDLVKTIESSIKGCEEIIADLKNECQQFDNILICGVKDKIKVGGRGVAYPFRHSTLQKLEENITGILDNLSLALAVLHLEDSNKTQSDIAEIKSLVELVKGNQISSAIHDWLKAPDATVNHNAACDKRHTDTGLWFIKSSTFTTWLTHGNSFLWLNGFAGCGKSVLCSTAIQHTFLDIQFNSGLAFFYFTFNDDSKQDDSAMLRALLLQLSGQLSDSHTDLERLHHSYKTGTPSAAILLEHLKRSIEKFHQVYIFLDALDESPQYGARERVLGAVETIRKWTLHGVHILVTSRDETDIRKSLGPAPGEEVIMKNPEVDRDISNFISSRLLTDPKLEKWQNHRDRIQQTLSERAHGVFRWAECQFEALQRCPGSDRRLDQCLRLLPPTLDETYERMLCNIDEVCVEDARRILTLLCYSSRPLAVHELIDGVAMELTERPRLDHTHRLRDANEICEICPGLVEIGQRKKARISLDDDSQDTELTIRIAHFSVQEYLESNRIHQAKAAMFGLKKHFAHKVIAQICLGYLLEPQLSDSPLDKTLLKQYPLARYAARYWHHHYANAGDATSELDPLILELFNQRQDKIFTWVRLHNVDLQWDCLVEFQPERENIASPLYYASLLGLETILPELIDVAKRSVGDPNSTGQKQTVNAQRGRFGNALQAASHRGHDKVVQMLLGAGADVNAEGGEYSNALLAALYGGHEKLVQMLLGAGADVNADGDGQGGKYKIFCVSYRDGKGVEREVFVRSGANALQVASIKGHEKVVQILLDAGANVNAQGARFRKFGNALQAASHGGHEKVVQMLLGAGADVNARSGRVGNALQAAAYGGYENVVQILLDAGVHVNAQGREYGNALQAASYGGHEKVVQMLLGAGADVNAQDERFGNALQAASCRGHEKVVQMLLGAGADVYAQDGRFGNALQAASYRGHEKVVQMLLGAGADVNIRGGFDNALHAASCGGHEKVVQMLLGTGADVNAQDGRFGNALQAASYGGHEEVVQMLLGAGADVNTQDGRFGNALQAASYGGHEKVVQMLLGAGADVSVQGGQFGNAFQAASYGGYEKVIQILLDAGVHVNAQGGEYGNALQAASYGGHEKVVQMLLDAGAGVRAQGGHFGNALQAASHQGHDKVVQILLGAGAHINAQGGEHSNALLAASEGGHDRVVQLLLDAGADIKTQGGDALETALYVGYHTMMGVRYAVNGQIMEAALLDQLFQNYNTGYKKVVQILLDAGAVVNDRKWAAFIGRHLPFKVRAQLLV